MAGSQSYKNKNPLSKFDFFVIFSFFLLVFVWFRFIVADKLPFVVNSLIKLAEKGKNARRAESYDQKKCALNLKRSRAHLAAFAERKRDQIEYSSIPSPAEMSIMKMGEGFFPLSFLRLPR